MSAPLYFDVHVPEAAAEQLRRRGVEVTRAQEDGHERASDPQLLARAGELGCILVTQDQDFFGLVNGLAAVGRIFPTVVFVAQGRVGLGRLVEDLELLATCSQPHETTGRLVHLRLRSP